MYALICDLRLRSLPCSPPCFRSPLCEQEAEEGGRGNKCKLSEISLLLLNTQKCIINQLIIIVINDLVIIFIVIVVVSGRLERVPDGPGGLDSIIEEPQVTVRLLHISIIKI